VDPQHLLTILLLIPLAGILFIVFLPEQWSRNTSIVLAGLMVLVSAVVGKNIHPDNLEMQLVEKMTWISWPLPVEYHVGVDGFSFCLVMLTSIVTLLAIIASESIGKTRSRLYYSMVMLLTASITGVFISLDLVQFFVLYELELIPMYFLIAIWGGPRRDYAAMKFLIYTFFGGIFMLGGLLYLYYQLGLSGAQYQTFDMVKLSTFSPILTPGVQLIGCLAFMIAFLIKLPSFPFHTWLPDAHVEAPTPISMILAGLLLKMGSYGLVRICMGFFPDALAVLGVPLMILGAFNIVWAAIACLVQDDMKRVIAFSSVSHMGFVTLGLGSLSAAGLNGAIFQMISHGFISALLFFMVGTVYDRCHTRQIAELGGGLAKQMPAIFYFWMLAALANLGLPALSGFVAEAVVFYGTFTSPIAASVHVMPVPFAITQADFVHGAIVLAATGVILSAGYMLWLLKRLFYGPELPKWSGHLSDMKPYEMVVAASFSVFIIGLGIYPLAITSQYTPLADRMAKDTAAKVTVSMRPQQFE
jgi:NADH-quinone oxidoreductase subunit M